jgi:lysozyme family protein
MADYQTALTGLLQREGGLSNHPHDNGRETYAGISRRFHPDWPGWRLIDACRAHPSFPDNLTDLACLQREVTSWYRGHYWDHIGGEHIASQRVANRLLDMAVHLGLRRAARILQHTLNLLLPPDTPPLRVDSLIGPRTQAAITRLNDSGRADILAIALSVRQGAHYLTRAEQDLTQRAFLHGWLRRLSPT